MAGLAGEGCRVVELSDGALADAGGSTEFVLGGPEIAG